VRRCVWSRNLKNEEAMTPRWVAAPQQKKKKMHTISVAAC
jgi:hypothetical protein